MELFDGLEQITNSYISRTQGKFFYYEIASKKTLLASIKSLTETKYRILGRLVTWKDFLAPSGDTLYPNFE
jgi:hypothetical protein